MSVAPRWVHVELVGGPHDGLGDPLREPWRLDDPPDLIFLDAAGTAYRRPGTGRQAYMARLSARPPGELDVLPVVAYLYVDHFHTTCRGCGGYHAREDQRGQRIEKCGACGHPLASVRHF